MKSYSERKGASIHIEGPEKAGKTSFIKTLAKMARKSGYYRKVVVVKYTKPAPQGEWVYYIDEMKEHLEKHILKGDLVIYDRGWMSELVYGELLPGSRSINNNLLIGGHLLNRASITNGRGIVLLGPDVETLEKNRDDSDLPVDVSEERRTYKHYADYFGWEFVQNIHTSAYTTILAKHLLKDLEICRNAHFKFAYSEYAGNLLDGRLIVLDEPNKFAHWKLITKLEGFANNVAWANIKSVNPAMLRHVHKIVALDYPKWQAMGIADTLGKTVSIHGLPSSHDLREMSEEEIEPIIERVKDYLS
jgi:hypothetical protein